MVTTMTDDPYTTLRRKAGSAMTAAIRSTWPTQWHLHIEGLRYDRLLEAFELATDENEILRLENELHNSTERLGELADRLMVEIGDIRPLP
jgi:hypothetical protein